MKPKLQTGSRKIGRLTAANATANAIREAILEGELMMGQTFSEAALCEMLGATRTPLREALVELEGEQLIEIVPYKGAQVFKLSVAQITQLGNFRKMLELGALEAAIDNQPAALADELEQIVEEMENKSSDSYGHYDTRFHECIIAHSGNDYLVHAYRLVALKLAVLRMLVERDTDMIGRSHEGHKDLIKHIRAVHKGEAMALLERHIDNGTHFYEAKTESALQLRAVGN